MHHFLSWAFVYRKWVYAEELRGGSTAAGLASALGDKMQDPDVDTECNDILMQRGHLALKGKFEPFGKGGRGAAASPSAVHCENMKIGLWKN